MIYKKKLTLLSGLVLVLALSYILTIIFDPERQGAKSSAYAWITSDLLDRADRIEIAGSQGNTVLSRKNNLWVISEGTIDYPVKQSRVGDLFRVLSMRNSFPVRSTSASAMERLGLVEGKASRITVRGGAGLPLLDLLVGFADAPGSGLYLRKANQNEARSGEDVFTLYTEGSKNSWLDLRLFPGLNIGTVQRVRVNPLPGDGAAYALSRVNNGWQLSDSLLAVETSKAESWVRAIIDAEAESFASSPDTNGFNEASITLELGDGTIRELKVGASGEEKRRNSSITNSPFVYSLAEWAISRIFREASYWP
ncbi:DUF4340 domain-containing protein [Leadbettera azotonutricia]|uniref:DUF4340 domain-containing protein n=1 Tax=Leadbettera azotonutricia (strain ATCC BAA-888 / DSM 13862 / ZAS-9) TaxID=545695 RepID=F5YCW8_LEAAZ|nr:DUF4340 domain-containing protein [Leadbettera azotonutricia]AEF82580.1 hypothetical protein TREAZ_0406 [Leadbettera azotonutricia ZAS-9]